MPSSSDNPSHDVSISAFSEQSRVKVAGTNGLTPEDVSLRGLPDGTVVGHFTFGEKLRRGVWGIVQATLFRWSPRRADRWRAMLLRLFGARIGRVDLIRSSVRIEIPWNIELGDHVQLGDWVYLYSLADIRIGDRTIVSQFAHLCAGTHDHERLDFPLVRVPITIGADCWIATDTFVGPGVSIGRGVVVGARANVVHDLPEWSVCVGSPAKAIRTRVLKDPATGRQISPGPESGSPD